MLQRKVDRWARRAEAEGADTGVAAAAKAMAAQVARQMVATGVVDDAAFAEARARRLVRAGRSRRAIAAHLAGKGVARDTAAAVLPEVPGRNWTPPWRNAAAAGSAPSPPSRCRASSG